MTVSTMRAAGKTAGYALAGSGIAVLVGTLIIGMLILSLIPIYTSNHSHEGYGEIYTIPGFTIKATYTNISVNFTGGSVISQAELSNLCTGIFRAKQIKDFYACIATNFVAYGPTGNIDRNSVLQRRALDDVAVYEVGTISLLFWSTCSNNRARGKWFSYLTHTENSSCVARRAATCRTFITTPNTGGLSNQWSPVPSGYTQLVATNGTACAAISISSIYNVAYYNYASVYYRYNISMSPVNAGDCLYSAIVPHSNLTQFVNNQLAANLSTCTGTFG